MGISSIFKIISTCHGDIQQSLKSTLDGKITGISTSNGIYHGIIMGSIYIYMTIMRYHLFCEHKKDHLLSHV